jgi:hypothetical protein
MNLLQGLGYQVTITRRDAVGFPTAITCTMWVPKSALQAVILARPSLNPRIVEPDYSPLVGGLSGVNLMVHIILGYEHTDERGRRADELFDLCHVTLGARTNIGPLPS